MLCPVVKARAWTARAASAAVSSAWTRTCAKLWAKRDSKKLRVEGSRGWPPDRKCGMAVDERSSAGGWPSSALRWSSSSTHVEHFFTCVPHVAQARCTDETGRGEIGTGAVSGACDELMTRSAMRSASCSWKSPGMLTRGLAWNGVPGETVVRVKSKWPEVGVAGSLGGSTVAGTVAAVGPAAVAALVLAPALTRPARLTSAIPGRRDEPPDDERRAHRRATGCGRT